MEYLIKEAFVHVDGIGAHVADGHYDLLGPQGEIILPHVWETVIEPDWTITMHMWPMTEEKEEDALADALGDIMLAEEGVPPPPPPAPSFPGGIVLPNRALFTFCSAVSSFTTNFVQRKKERRKRRGDSLPIWLGQLARRKRSLPKPKRNKVLI